MRRGDYLVLAWAPDDGEATRRAGDLRRRLDADGGWRRAATTGHMLVWTSAEGRLDVRVLPHAAGLVLGDLFPTRGSGATSPLRPEGYAAHGPFPIARALTQSHWGAYVAVLRGIGKGPGALYRDPSGDLDAVGWSLAGGLEVAASSVLRLPSWLRPPQLALNWGRIAGQLAAASACRLENLLDGVRTLAPGELSWLAPDRAPRAVWRPADFVLGQGPDQRDVSAELVRRVDEATDALTGLHTRLLVELSGGLDSAILAGAMAANGHAGKVAQWVNRYGDRPEGDERSYARAVTERLGVELTAVAKPMTPIDIAALEELTTALRPALNGADPARDRDMAERLRATGASAILSGQGGDAVFFQMPSALVFADALRRDGLAALCSPLLGAIARRRRAPAWSVLCEAWRACRGSPALPVNRNGLLAPDAGGELDLIDPWLRDAGHLPPAKRLQIQSIGAAQVFRADCRRRRVGDLVYPLLAQPVVELCLSIPSPHLAGADYDRPFARAAFSDRIPEVIRDRRSKGDLTSYFGRWVAAGADVLRPYLLDGCLCAAGLLDRGLVEDALDPARMIWLPQPGDVISAAIVEAWVRHWQGQVPDSAAAPRPQPSLSLGF